MERKRGSFILNNSRDSFDGRAKVIHVISATVFSTISDTNRNTINFYIASTGGEIPAGTMIAARDGASFSKIQLTSGAVEIIF